MSDYFHKVRIESEKDRPTFHHVYLDGMEVKGVTAMDLHIDTESCPVLKLEIMATEIEADEWADIQKSVTYTDEFMNRGIEHLDLSVRAFNCIKRGIIKDAANPWQERDRNETIGDVVAAYRNGHLKRYKYLGKKSYLEVEEKLQKFGLIGGESNGG